MSITQIPPKGPLPSPSPAARPDGSELYEPQRWESAYRKFDADNVPHLLIQLQDVKYCGGAGVLGDVCR